MPYYMSASARRQRVAAATTRWSATDGCLNCGAMTGQRYCSAECGRIYRNPPTCSLVYDNCVTCGRLFCTRARSRPSKTCGPQCRRIWLSREQMAWQRKYQVEHGVLPRYRAPRTFRCRQCGDAFQAVARSRGNMFCSRSCAKRRHAIEAKLPVVYAGPAFVPPPRPVVHVQTAHRLTSGACRVCGDWFVSFHLDVTCSSSCQDTYARRAKRVAKDRRRAREREAFVEDVDRVRIFERDGWRCQLCRRKVIRDAVVPNPLAPTLDHIVPLALGGLHEARNCQCACFECNSRKGVQPCGTQLMLIG